MIKWLKYFFGITLTEQEKKLLEAISKFPEGSYTITKRGSVYIDPKLVNSLPETIRAREQARKIVEGH